jgi:hypothetical protein
LPVLVSALDAPTSVSQVSGITSVYQHTQLVYWHGDLTPLPDKFSWSQWNSLLNFYCDLKWQVTKFIVFFFWDRVSLCCQAVFGLEILLPLPPKCWDFRHVPPRPTVFIIFFFPFWFELRASRLLGRPFTAQATPPALFCVGFSRDRVLRPGWLWTLILLISDSQVARIIGVSHWHLALFFFVGWDLNSGLHTCKAGTLLLSRTSNPFFSGTICLG